MNIHLIKRLILSLTMATVVLLPQSLIAEDKQATASLKELQDLFGLQDSPIV